MSTSPATSPSLHPFDADTRLHKLGDDRFSATITDRWNTLGGRAFGGYGLAICLQALRKKLPQPDPLVVCAFFPRALRPGAGEVEVVPVRAGRRTAVGEARLRQQGNEALRVLATFADLLHASGPTRVSGEPPRLPPPESCLDLAADGCTRGVAVSDRIECRGSASPGWNQRQPTGDPSSEFWMRFREPREADVYSLPLLVDAAAPAVFELGATGSLTLQLTVYVRAHPVPGWLSCRAVTRYLIDGYHEENFEIWDGDGKLVAQSRQLAMVPPAA